MKIKLFSPFAESHFKNLPNGERVFYFGFPWSKPYSLPDENIEKRIYVKLLWIYRILLGSILIGQPFLVVYLPNIIKNPTLFFVYFFGVTSFFWLVCWIALRRELIQIRRTASPYATFSAYYYGMATVHSEERLFLGFFVTVITILFGGLSILFDKVNLYVGLVLVVVLAYTAFGWGYALSIKSKIREKDEHTDTSI